MKCRRCGQVHPGKACRVAFGRAWPGLYAAQIWLRAPNGGELKIESDVTPELAKELADIIDRIAKQPEPGAAEGSGR